jgi:hypothetical protein
MQLSCARRLGFVAVLAMAAYLPVSSPAQAKEGEHPVDFTWTMIAPAISGSATLDLRTGKALELGKASPAHSFRLPVNAYVSNGSVFLPAGTELAWSEGARRIACEPERQKGQDYSRCLWDSDGDGTLDYALKVPARTTTLWSLTMVEYLIGHFIALEFVGPDEMPKPIPIASLKEEPSNLQVPLHLEARAGRKRVWIALCASRQGYAEVCTTLQKIDVRGPKGEADLFGNHIIADIAPDGSATIDVTPISAEIAL